MNSSCTVRGLYSKIIFYQKCGQPLEQGAQGSGRVTTPGGIWKMFRCGTWGHGLCWTWQCHKYGWTQWSFPAYSMIPLLILSVDSEQRALSHTPLHSDLVPQCWGHSSYRFVYSEPLTSALLVHSSKAVQKDPTFAKTLRCLCPDLLSSGLSKKHKIWDLLCKN